MSEGNERRNARNKYIYLVIYCDDSDDIQYSGAVCYRLRTECQKKWNQQQEDKSFRKVTAHDVSLCELLARRGKPHRISWFRWPKWWKLQSHAWASNWSALDYLDDGKSRCPIGFCCHRALWLSEGIPNASVSRINSNELIDCRIELLEVPSIFECPIGQPVVSTDQGSLWRATFCTTFQRNTRNKCLCASTADTSMPLDRYTRRRQNGLFQSWIQLKSTRIVDVTLKITLLP